MMKELFIYLMYVTVLPMMWVIGELSYVVNLPEYQSIAVPLLIGGLYAYVLKEKIEPRLRSSEQE